MPTIITTCPTCGATKCVSHEKHGKLDDIVIAVMGATGSGKSSFIKLLSGDSSVVIGNDLDSQTSNVHVIPFRDPKTGRTVRMVDTPGFDDSREELTDTEILKIITKFLLEEYDENRKLNGLIFVQRISDPRFTGQSKTNLRRFRSLCGTEAYKNVVVLTTFWDQVPEEKGLHREAELMSKFFKELVDGGAEFMRHDGCKAKSAGDVLSHILTLNPANVLITKEIREEGKALVDTEAGMVHRAEVEAAISTFRQELAEVSAELKIAMNSNKKAVDELTKEGAELQKKLKRWEEEKVDLKRGLQSEMEFREKLTADWKQKESLLMELKQKHETRSKLEQVQGELDQTQMDINLFSGMKQRLSSRVKLIKMPVQLLLIVPDKEILEYDVADV